MKPSRSRAAEAALQAQLTAAAQSFAQELLRILRSSTLEDLTLLAQAGGPPRRGPGRPRKEEDGHGSGDGAGLPLPLFTPSPGPEGRPPVPPRTSALRRIAGTKPVCCPVPGCPTPGVRSKMNFCHAHFTRLAKAERVRLRAAQRRQHQPQSLALSDERKT